MEAKFIGSLKTEWLGIRKWKLLESFSYMSSSGAVFTVPEGFVSNTFSSPREAWWLWPPSGEYDPASWLHDHLYSTHSVDKQTADFLFREFLLVLGCPRWKANVLWFLVAVGGDKNWREANV